MRLIHTADWQIGKPFARIADERKRSLLQHERIEAIGRIGQVVEACRAELVLVAGDLFDSASACKADVSSVCSSIGRLGVPVVVIPGNHDSGGPGSVWRQEFFLREQAELAPNLHVLLEPEPVEFESVVILPCPLLHQAGAGDPTEWLRSPDVYSALPPGKARIVLAHGSVQAFSGGWDDPDETQVYTNLIDLTRLPEGEVDYFALGDWHGTKQVGPRAWYSGTHESDRFPKGGEHDPGNVLVVQARRGLVPEVEKVRTGRLSWTEVIFDFADDGALDELEKRLVSGLGARAGEHVLKLILGGSLGIEASDRLTGLLERLEARTLWLRLKDSTLVAPREDEIRGLTESVANPLMARVAAQLAEQARGLDEPAVLARVALRELHAVYMREHMS